ncbi:uncharacterized protein [Lolium perenne]|uniref:uncharacterized protein n=1 Tax=Lolium perenne TaxID=4522 RepID=UPI0021F5321B|nr:protein REVEILLE 7-like [Lolium perenne]
MARFQETATSDDQNLMGDLGRPMNPSDMDALAGARFPKARKPYMITKQREKWTEEEHKLFLEAMQLHGRAWRRIQEHIGTKTAVQIRSHAQKFFSKVIRESSGDNSSGAGAEAPIQIPPPRPKRKSVHPYPCNRRSAPGKHAHALAQLQRPDRQVQSVCEQGNGSPTSVVTASQIGSECSDSDTSTIDIEERCPTPGVDTAEVAVQVPPTDVRQGSTSSEEVVCGTSEAPQIKLFGKTVAVNNSHQQPEPSTGNLQAVADMELDTSAETPTSGAGNPGGPQANAWSPWMANAQQFMYYVPQGAVFFSYNGGSVHQPSEAENKHREASRAESNTASTSVPETTTRNSAESCTEADGGDDKMAPAAGFRKFVAPSSVHQRGFMPYKRCAAESKVLQPQAVSEEADGDMTRLCL